jgi:diaminopropionate ammonia-lyase
VGSTAPRDPCCRSKAPRRDITLSEYRTTLYHLGPVVPSSSAHFSADELTRVRAFFDGRPDLKPTPLRPLPDLAREIGVGALLLKDESQRFGLPAFKIVGVTYAVHRLMEAGRLTPGRTVACATAGNHGRAVARVARDNNLRARVYVPAGTVRARIDALEGEGAEVVVHHGDYEDAVATMAREAARQGWVIVSDTSWPGDEAEVSEHTDHAKASYYTPHLIMAGYSRIFDEARAAWDAPPDFIFVQAGVGGLLAAAAAWVSTHGSIGVVSCEPVNAACVLAAAAAGKPTRVAGTLETTMAGLKSAEVSLAAWPIVATSVRAFVTARDEDSYQVMRRLASAGIVAGPSGACGLAALAVVMRDPALAPVREHLGLTNASRVLVVNTEGNTDPELMKRVVG